jgi:DNA mismatch repair protein MLH3
VIGPADSKYIFCLLTDGTITAFDQHAVDERIRYESFHHSCSYCHNMCLRCFDQKSRTLLDTNTYPLHGEEKELLDDVREIFHRWGFRYHINEVSNDTVKDCHYTIKISRVPVILDEPLDVRDFFEFLHHLKNESVLHSSHIRQSTNVAVNDPIIFNLTKPPAINRIYAWKACRSAIKFGDHINSNQSEELMNKLSQTDFPFQCAHGRPTMFPLIKIDPISSREFAVSNNPHM